MIYSINLVLLHSSFERGVKIPFLPNVAALSFPPPVFLFLLSTLWHAAQSLAHAKQMLCNWVVAVAGVYSWALTKRVGFGQG